MRYETRLEDYGNHPTPNVDDHDEGLHDRKTSKGTPSHHDNTFNKGINTKGVDIVGID
jgi:hypothetical protein